MGRGYTWLSWFNAIALALILAWVIAFWVHGWWLDREFARGVASAEQEFGHAKSAPDSYQGEQFPTSGGDIIAYSPWTESAGRKGGANVTLTRMSDGKSLQIGKDDQSVVNWEVIYANSESRERRVAVGYIAFVANKAQFADGRMDIVVGSVPSLIQHTIATDTRGADLPQVHGNGSVAMIIWQEDTQAWFTVVSLTDGKIIDHKSVLLSPRPKNELSLGAGQPIDRSLPDGAPVNRFGF